MKIAVVAHGSRGDAQPPLALAARLVERGHDVRVCLAQDFATAADGIGATAKIIPVEVRADLNRDDIGGHVRRGATIRAFATAFAHERKRDRVLQDAVVDATEGAELIVAPALLEDLCISVAEARGQRVALAYPSALWPNTTYPSLLFGTWMPSFLYGATHAVTEIASLQLVSLANDLRERLGLRRVRRRPATLFRAQRPPVLYWVPPEVLPPPNAYGDHHHFTGYWSATPRLRAALGEATPSEALVRFVEEQSPIYVGFGSMPVLDERVIEIVAQAARALGRRVVLAGGWSRVEHTSTDDVMFVRGVDHDWLFPRCAAVVHHGGASTTGAAIRAGVPQVIVSVFADQPFWGARVAALGLGATFRFQALTAQRLGAALRVAMSPAMTARARMFARDLGRRPDGALVAAQLLDELESPIPARL